MNACGHLVPLVVVSVPEKSNNVERLLKTVCACVCACVCVWVRGDGGDGGGGGGGGGVACMCVRV